LLIVGFLAVCVMMAKSARDKKAPEIALSPGLTYKLTQDRYEDYPGRYEIRVQFNREPTEADVKAVSQAIQSSKDQDATYIIFFDIEGKRWPYGRVDLPGYKFDKFVQLEE
jgi:predicted component of type VI protein secretion system